VADSAMNWATFTFPHPLAVSRRPIGGHPNQRTRVIHLTRELNRLAADLTVLDVTERTRRYIGRGIERLTAIRALHRHELREVRCVRAATQQTTATLPRPSRVDS
jgi:hypothetical protein